MTKKEPGLRLRDHIMSRNHRDDEMGEWLREIHMAWKEPEIETLSSHESKRVAALMEMYFMAMNWFTIFNARRDHGAAPILKNYKRPRLMQSKRDCASLLMSSAMTCFAQSQH